MRIEKANGELLKTVGSRREFFETMNEIKFGDEYPDDIRFGVSTDGRYPTTLGNIVRIIHQFNTWENGGDEEWKDVLLPLKRKKNINLLITGDMGFKKDSVNLQIMDYVSEEFNPKNVYVDLDKLIHDWKGDNLSKEYGVSILDSSTGLSQKRAYESQRQVFLNNLRRINVSVLTSIIRNVSSNVLARFSHWIDVDTYSSKETILCTHYRMKECYTLLDLKRKLRRDRMRNIDSFPISEKEKIKMMDMVEMKKFVMPHFLGSDMWEEFQDVIEDKVDKKVQKDIDDIKI